jgi:hypothetical protein
MDGLKFIWIELIQKAQKFLYIETFCLLMKKKHHFFIRYNIQNIST